VNRLGVQQSVWMPGFQQYEALPKYFAFASAFVHASKTEQWGLVVNEAMASGLPVLVSERCGCAADLVRSDCNGFLFDPADMRMLTRRMQDVSSVSIDHESMMNASREIIRSWTPEIFARGLRNAVHMGACDDKNRVGIMDRILLSAMSCS
jgi:glycosyltransferase involved in cell wall biosynthesis